MMDSVKLPDSLNATVEIHENERAWIGGGFGKKGLLPTDRGRYSTPDGSLSWKTLREAGDYMLEKGWVYDDADFRPVNLTSENSADDDDGNDEETWQYCRDFSQSAMDDTKSKRNLMSHWVRFRRLIRKKVFVPDKFVSNNVYEQCDHVDSVQKDDLSNFLLESLSFLTIVQNSTSPTSAVVLPLKKTVIQLLEIEKGNNNKDVFQNIEMAKSRVQSFIEKERLLFRNSVSIVASVPFKSRHSSRAPGFATRCQQISSTHFPRNERHALATLALKNFDPTFQIHCDTPHCGPSCQFAPVACPNDGCAVTISRQHLASHDAHCQFKIIPCRLGCGDTFPRSREETHLADVCALREVPCPFSGIGCTAVIVARDVAEHISSNMESHLLLSLNRINDYERVIKDLNGRVKVLEEENHQFKLSFAENKTSVAKQLTDVQSGLTKLSKRVDGLDNTNQKEFKKVWQLAKDVQKAHLQLKKELR